MTQALLDAVSKSLAVGRPRDALAAVLEARVPVASAAPELAVDVAETLAAVGQERRGRAVLRLAHHAHPAHRALALAWARACLAAGDHGRAQRALEAHVASASVLMAVARRETPPPPPAPVDIDDEIDAALAATTTTAALAALLERAPGSARLRIAVAARVRHEGRLDEGRSLLRAGLKGREDARLEVALAAAAVQDGSWDEAAMVIARARARYPRLARSSTMRLLLATIAVGAGKPDDAVSIIHGAGNLQAGEEALLAVLRLQPISAPAPVPTAVAAASIDAQPQAPTGMGQMGPGAPPPETRWRGPVVQADEPADKGSPWVWLAMGVVLVVGVSALTLPKYLRGSDGAVDAGVVAVVDAGASPDAGSEPSGPSAFAIAARGCGVPLDAWADPSETLAEQRARALALGWQGRQTSIGTSPIPIEARVLPAATLTTMRTGGRVDPAIVQGTDGGLRGFAYVSIVATNRVRVSDVVNIADMKFNTIVAGPCPAANPVQRCGHATSVCGGLAISLQALCPTEDVTLAALPSCEFDIVTITTTTQADTPATPAEADAGIAVQPVDAVVVDAGVAVDALVVDAGAVDVIVDAGAADVVDAGVDGQTP